jgi:hypothetical protein
MTYRFGRRLKSWQSRSHSSITTGRHGDPFRAVLLVWIWFGFVVPPTSNLCRKLHKADNLAEERNDFDESAKDGKHVNLR